MKWFGPNSKNYQDYVQVWKQAESNFVISKSQYISLTERKLIKVHQISLILTFICNISFM